MTNLLFEKAFQTAEHAILEINGHGFYSHYYDRLPVIKSWDLSADMPVVRYQHIVHERARPLCELLADGSDVAIDEVFFHLKKMMSLATVMQSQGGTKLFYIDRISRLQEPAVKRLYRVWYGRHAQGMINGRHLKHQRKLLVTLESEARALSHGLCTPSQGDLHERNICSDMTIVDMEGAGWNLVSTDIATFIWHTLFAGSYFGPLYAKWATPSDGSQVHSNQFKLDDDAGLSVSVPANRQRLVKKYLKDYVSSIPNEHKSICLRAASYAIAFRLLTTFDLRAMSDYDRQLSFILANYFVSEDASLLRKIDALLI